MDVNYNNNFDRYVSDNLKYNPGLTLDKAKQKVLMGCEVYNEISVGKVDGIGKKALSNLHWYFMYCAVSKGEGFKKGAIVVEDVDGKIYGALGKLDLYDRPSSHIASSRRQNPKSQKGVDLPNESLHGTMGTMIIDQVMSLEKAVGPTLFRNIKEKENQPPNQNRSHPLLYLKTERCSIRKKLSKEGIKHGGHWAKRVAEKKVGAKSITDSNARREDVPKKILKDFIKRVIAKEPDRKQVIEMVKDFGISYIYAYMIEHDKRDDPLFKEICKGDHTLLRTGNEVILTKDDLKKPKFD